MKPTNPNPTKALFAAAVLCLGASLDARAASLLTSYDFGANQNTTIWTTLGTGNEDLDPNEGSDDGTLAVNTPGYQTPNGFYSYSGPYSVTIQQTSEFDIESAILQLEISPYYASTFPYGTGPLLSYNGGSQMIAAGFFDINATEQRGMMMGQPVYYHGAAWQWDLSGIEDTITSITITAPASIHSAIVAAQVDTGGNHLTMVPEPSSAGLALLTGGLLVLRRRRSR